MLVERLKRSRIYCDYEAAFREITGLPINLRPVGAFDLHNHGDPKENPHCALMAGSNHSCAACLRLQMKVEEAAKRGPKTLQCFAGLCDSSVPVRLGDHVVAFLETGQILLHQPSKREFAKTKRELLKWGSVIDLQRLEQAYFETRVLTKKQNDSILCLLAIFAQQLSGLSNQLAVRESTAQLPVVTMARVYIAKHQSEELSLGQVARAVNITAFYFCKVFKQSTGLTFIDYLARARIEAVKAFLLNPHTRISEAAYAAGFQSLSQFNRVFRRIVGENPSAYRERLHGVGLAAAV